MVRSRRLQATAEQLEAIEKFRTGRPLKINAFAGAGKTTTLRLLADSRSTRGLYIAFNKAIADEARQKFPQRVECRTTHSIAFREVMPRYRSTAKMTQATSPKQLAAAANLEARSFSSLFNLTNVQQAHLIQTTIRNFCQSAAPTVDSAHFPEYGRLLGLREATREEVKRWAVIEARRVWSRMQDPADALPLGHDGYLKLWALGGPSLSADYILLDEAQDTNEVVLDVLGKQHGQVVYVGDKHQQIYEWRGAINAMDRVNGCEEAYLTQSFRFGADLASAASRVLGTLGEARPIIGNPAVSSRIKASGDARTILARTNATVISEVLSAAASGQRPFVVGGTKELMRLVSDVYELKKGKPGTCPEFFGFTSWSEVVRFSESEEGHALRMFVQLIEKHGEGSVWAAVKSSEEEEQTADVVISTAHKAKGCEWDSVRIAADFGASASSTRPMTEAEVRLFYVAITRARQTLIVDPQVMQTFSSGACRAAKGSQQPQTRGESRSPQNSAAHVAGHASSTSRSQRNGRTASTAGLQQQRREITEVISQSARQSHPASVRAPATPTKSPAPPRSMLKRLLNFLIGAD